MDPISTDLASGGGKACFVPPSSSAFENQPTPPDLSNGEDFHVFVSYSSSDGQWTQGLISWLESAMCGLRACFHERDFVPGCTILDNMTSSIMRSQKVLLVLSQDFVRSRWCLLEANLSIFRNCLERRPVVPVLLEPDVSVPVHLCHLTYLSASDPCFPQKLLEVLCTPNQQLGGSTVVPYQPPSIYNGKALPPLAAVNEENVQKWQVGQFSEQGVPDQLRLVIQNNETYSAAIRTVNSVSQKYICCQSPLQRKAVYFLGPLCLSLMVVFVVVYSMVFHPPLVASVFPFIALFFKLLRWQRDDQKYLMNEMQKSAGQANIALSEEKVLMGCQSRTKLCFVYVTLDRCKQVFRETFKEHALTEEMFQKALCQFSSQYACCLATKHFPFTVSTSDTHLEDGVCFCQYVSHELKKGEWM